MDAETKFRCIQFRAYEIYCERDPAAGNAEDDWRRAEAEVEREENGNLESLNAQNLGPARLKDKAHWGCLASHQGEDIENPA
jgi:hypothetical protein